MNVLLNQSTESVTDAPDPSVRFCWHCGAMRHGMPGQGNNVDEHIRTVMDDILHCTLRMRYCRGKHPGREHIVTGLCLMQLHKIRFFLSIKQGWICSHRSQISLLTGEIQNADTLAVPVWIE